MNAQPPLGRRYRVKVWERIFAVLGVLFFVGFPLVYGSDLVKRDSKSSTLVLLGLTAIATYSVYDAVRMFMSSVSFTQDGIELAGAFRIRELPLAAIRGRREYMRSESKSRTRYSVFVSSDDRYPAMEFAKKLFKFDEPYWAWYERLPDLDAEDEQRWTESEPRPV